MLYAYDGLYTTLVVKARDKPRWTVVSSAHWSTIVCYMCNITETLLSEFMLI